MKKTLILLSIIAISSLNAFQYPETNIHKKTSIPKVIDNTNQEDLTKEQLDAKALQEKVNKLKQEIIRQKSLTLFALKDNKINVNPNQKYITAHIPYNNISEFIFDKKIQKIETIQNPKLGVEFNYKSNPYKLILKNKDDLLQQQIKITFIDDTEIKLILDIGKNPNKRFVTNYVYIDSAKKSLIPEFQKKLKIKNIHVYFNNVATKLIIDRLTMSEDFQPMLKNAIKIPKNLSVIWDGKAKIADLYGEHNIDYKIILEYVFETPYVKDLNFNQIKRLVLNEMTIVNNSSEKTLVLSESFIKNRFSNYVAFYVGNIEEGDNKIIPNGRKRILIVTEEKETKK